MNVNHSICPKDSVDRFLRGELSEEDIQELESHLSTCPQCSKRLEESTASDNEWHALKDSLRDGEDCGSPSDSYLREDLQSLQLLLGPSDDPRMMGRIGTYEVVGLLGRGGMGIVFKAFDSSLNRYVAIKMLAPMLMPSGAFKQRFLREAQSAAAVVHDNVVGIHAASEWQGIPYLVMTFVRGQSLHARLQQRGHLSLIEVLRIGMQIAAGLDAAHAQGLIHRDIKPANILLESDVDRVKITDFGIARAIDDLRFTGTNTLLGTPEYMSPEQARDEQLDYQTDLFSLGCVLYEASSGRSPFRSSTPYGAIRKVIELDPPSTRSLVPDLPEWFDQIVRRLLCKDKSQRFRSAAEVAAQLKQCLAHVEQPQLVPLPNSLFPTNRQPLFATFFRRLIMTVSFVAFASLGTWMLFLQIGQPGSNENANAASGAQSPGNNSSKPDNSKANAGSEPAAQQQAQLTTNAGKFVIKVIQTETIDQMKLKMKPTFHSAASSLLQNLENNSSQGAANGFQSNEQSTGGNSFGGNAGGSAGGFGGGFAGGSSSGGGFNVTSGGGSTGTSKGLVRPNIAMAFEIEPRDKAIFEFEKIEAQDDQGKQVTWMANGPFQFFDREFEKRQKGALIAYFQEEDVTDHLSISGELKVTPGRILEVEFPSGKPATQKKGEHTFILKDLQNNERGIQVTLTLPQLVKKRGNQFGNPQAMMKALLEQQGAFEVLIQDYEGDTYYPGGSGSSGGGSSAGGFSSGGGAFGQETQTASSQTFSFAGLPSGREIKSVIVRAVEKTGKPQSIPFKLPNVPIPYGKK